MMPVIRIPDPIFERLQAIASPFVDTPASVIERLLNFYESHRRPEVAPDTQPRSESAHKIATFSPETPPDLHHTRILTAKFDGQTASNWNDLVYLAHRQAFKSLGSLDTLRSITQSNVSAGRRSDSGYHYIPEINASIQNVDANLAWRNTVNLARRLQVPVEVVFEWRQVEGAANPGKRASISCLPIRSDRRADA